MFFLCMIQPTKCFDTQPSRVFLYRSTLSLYIYIHVYIYSLCLLCAHLAQRALQDLIKQAEENMKDPALVRLGDASIASPFTSREASIRCSEQVPKHF